MYMLSSKYGFGQSMDKVAMDPYFERAIHGLSKHKITHRVVLEQASFLPPPHKGSSMPPSKEKCPFIIGTRCRCFEEEDTINFIF